MSHKREELEKEIKANNARYMAREINLSKWVTESGRLQKEYKNCLSREKVKGNSL